MTKRILRRFREGGMPGGRRGRPDRGRRPLRHRGPAERGQDLPRARRPRARQVRGPLSRSRGRFVPHSAQTANPIGSAMTDFDAIAKGMAMAVPFVGHLGIEVTEMAEGEATVVLPERAELDNHVGSQHAGALFSVAETASRGGLRRRLRRAHGRRHAARPQRRDRLRKDRQAARSRRTRDARRCRPPRPSPPSTARAVEFPCEVELTDAEGTRSPPRPSTGTSGSTGPPA